MESFSAQLCPVCGVTWMFQRGGQHVTCIRDRHIVDAHPGHAFALVVVARRNIERANDVPGPNHPLDEPCPDAPAAIDVSVGQLFDIPPHRDPGPLDLLTDVELLADDDELGFDELDLDLTDDEITLFNLVVAGYNMSQRDDDEDA